MNRDKLMASLVEHESIRLTVYDDATGKAIIPGSKVMGHPTVGIGRALDVKGLTQQEGFVLANNDIDACVKSLHANLDFFDTLSDVRQNVMAEMCFQLGIGGLMAFRAMLVAMRAKNWVQAAAEGLNSQWHQQTPGRAEALMKMMANDTWNS